MAITYVGSVSVGQLDGGTATVNPSTISGIAVGDLLIGLSCTVQRNGSEGAINNAGTTGGAASWTAIVAEQNTDDIKSRIWRKFMVGSVDTAFAITGSGNAADSNIAVVHAFRGVDTTTPIDVATTFLTSNTAGTNPDPPSITTVTNGAAVLAIGCTAIDDAGVAPTGYGDLHNQLANDTNDCTAMFAWKIVATAGAENPDAFTGVASARKIAFSVALRPSADASIQVDANTGDLSLTGQVATVTTTANVTVSANVGDLSLNGQIAVVTASDHKTISAITGDLNLNGQTASVVIGINVFAETGDLSLTGQVAVVTTTNNQTVSANTGDLSLTGQIAVVTAGNAVEVTPDTGDLSLTGQTATVTVTANILVNAETGDLSLIGQIATVTVSGVAQGGDDWIIRVRRRERR